MRLYSSNKDPCQFSNLTPPRFTRWGELRFREQSPNKDLPAQGQAPSREQCDIKKCFRNVSGNGAGIGPERGRNEGFIRSRESHKTLDSIGFLVAGPTRLELATSGVTVRHSNQTELRPRIHGFTNTTCRGWLSIIPQQVEPIRCLNRGGVVKPQNLQGLPKKIVPIWMKGLWLLVLDECGTEADLFRKKWGMFRHRRFGLAGTGWNADSG